MTEEIIMSLISAGVAIISCLISSFIASSKAISYIEKTQAVTVVEEQVKIINHRINNLEKNNGR